MHQDRPARCLRLAQRLGLKGRGALAARLRQARRFGLEAVAVGAEDEVTMEGLADVGFTSAQGIWIQKPLSNAELLAWDGRWARGSVAIDVKLPVAPQPPADPRPRRHANHQPTLQQKQFEDPGPRMPVLQEDDLLDVVEDEDDGQVARRPGFGTAPDANLTMKGLVVRRPSRNIA